MEDQIQKLKEEAGKYFLKYCKARDHLDCGKKLAEHISSEVSTNKRLFNETMDKLAELDPNCPKGRL